MADETAGYWKCRVCGYVHRGPRQPGWCPICGAPRDAFEPDDGKEVTPSSEAKVEQWRCAHCHYVHVGPQPPSSGPVCGAPAHHFEPLSEAPKPPTGAVQVNRIVIVGAGIAGIAATESARAHSPAAEITLISKEPGLPYYRLNLTRYLAGEVEEDALPIHGESWYQEQHIQLLRGTEVSRIALDDRVVETRTGTKEPFDKLVLTAGAHPFIPPLPGSHREGVTTFYTLDDAKLILDGAMQGARCVCIGGGLLGLETAGALVRRGVDVTVLEGYDWLLPLQLNPKAGEVLGRRVSELGIKLRTGVRIVEIAGDKRARSVVLDDGTGFPADLVVIATGVRPNSYLGRLTGLDVHQGVIVGNYLSSSHPDVLAAGDVAEHRGVVYGTWIACRTQGNIAGMNAVGLETQFVGLPRTYTLKVVGVDVFSIGQVESKDASFEVIDQEEDGQYFRFVFRDHHLVGAVLVGDTTSAVRVKKAVETRADFSGLLRRRPSSADVVDHLVQGGA